MTNTTFIYALADPDTFEIRYVGKSNKPKERLKEHIYDIDYALKRGIKLTHKEKWIQSLIKKGTNPCLFIVAEVLVDNHPYWEEFVIRLCNDSGCKLTNWDDQGQGIKAKKARKPAGERQNIKGVLVYNLDGEYFGTYPSLREASRLLGVSHANISRCCKGEYKFVGNYVFRYIGCDKKVDKIINPNARKKSVVRLDLSGRVLEEYSSIEEAAKLNNVHLSNVSRVCSGERKSIKKLIFKFKKND